MHRFLAPMAGLVITFALGAAPAIADESADSARVTAVAACNKHAGAKNVTVAVKVDGKTTRYRYVCSEILANAGSNVPAASDFTVGIDVVAKQCFPNGGCSIAYRPKVKYHGAAPLDPSKDYTLVFDVAGADSPITANVSLRGTKVNARNSTAYIPSKNGNLSATVTSVVEGAGS